MQDTTIDSILNIQVKQHASGYRFSVDPVLLYGFMGPLPPGSRSAADLGAGSGVLGLLLARNNPALRVALIEIQEGLHSLLVDNIALNGLNERAYAVRADLMQIVSACPALEGLDMVVTNPPFRPAGKGKLSQGDERAMARHEIALDLPGLLRAASVLLRPRGRLYMVYHPERLMELMDALRAQRLEPKRIRFVHGRYKEPAKIILVEAAKDARAGLEISPPLIMYEEGGQGVLTPEMLALYGESGPGGETL